MSQSRPNRGRSVVALSAVVLALAVSGNAGAETFTLDLSSTALWDKPSSTGLWNPVLARIQGAVFANGAAIDFGDGSDGAFADGPAQTGITVAGSTITFNTDVKAVYQFSSFTLTTGKTLAANGSLPLTIRVLGTTTLEGTAAINLNGRSGQDNGTSGVGNALAGAIPGGAGAAGGGSGGNGGALAGTPIATAGSPGSRAGKAGLSSATTNEEEGGGGGCNGNTPPASGGKKNTVVAGGGIPGTCALSQTALANAFETAFEGGAGGGGGGSCNGGSCIRNVAGGGGGGGGGALHFASLGSISLEPTSSIAANGGNGGKGEADDAAPGVNTLDCGGSGGGGSGGSVWLQSSVGITNGGTIGVVGGSGGVSTNATGFCNFNLYDGGDGSLGVFRVDSNPLASIAPAGQEFLTAVPNQAFEIYSNLLGFETGYYTLLSAAHTAGCGAGGLAVNYQGSNNADFSDAVEVSEANIAQLGNLPYIRFKVAVAASATPACLTALTITYEPSTLSELSLTGSLFFCSSTRGNTGRPPRGPLDSPHLFLGNLLLFGFAGYLALRIRHSPVIN